MEPREEAKVIARVMAGEADAFAVIVRRYQVPIYNLMMRMSKNPADALDLSQETFLRAYNNLEKFKSGSRFFPWLYQMGMNLALDYLRKRKRTVDNHCELDEGRADTIRDDAHERAFLERIEAEELRVALEQLPMDTREALILRFHEDLSMQEVAEALSISVSGAKMRVHRGLARLRVILVDGQGNDLSDKDQAD